MTEIRIGILLLFWFKKKDLWEIEVGNISLLAVSLYAQHN